MKPNPDEAKNDRFDDAERSALNTALNQKDGSLWPYVFRNGYGGQVKEGLDLAANHYQAESEEKLFPIASSSGTASIHIALAGLGIPAGSEVIVPPITDMGTITPVIAQNAIPVFADLDPETGLITAETIKAARTERTSAVIVVHLTGSPANMPEIIDYCEPLGIKVIEDVSQALGAHVKNVPVGVHGDAGCFSLNTWKHITVGEGGFVLVKDHETYRRCLGFSDKYRNRLADTYSHEQYSAVGLNYRISQLQGAMLTAQWDKLPGIAKDRNAFGSKLDELLKAVGGITPQRHLPNAFPTFFGYMFRVHGLKSQEADMVRKRDAAAEVVEELEADEIQLLPHAYATPIYKNGLFRNKNFFAGFAGEEQHWPAELIAQKRDSAISYDYRKVSCPVAEDYYTNGFWLRVKSNFEPALAARVAKDIAKAFKKHELI